MIAGITCAIGATDLFAQTPEDLGAAAQVQADKRLAPAVASAINGDPHREITILVVLRSENSEQSQARASVPQRAEQVAPELIDVPFTSGKTVSEMASVRLQASAAAEQRLESNRRAFHRSQQALADRVEAAGGRVLYRLASSNIVAARMKAGNVLVLLQNPEVEFIEWDHPMQAQWLEQSVASVGAATFWNAGFDGTGVQLAIMDTGIDLAHPTFSSAPKSAQVFLASGSGDPCFNDFLDTEDRAGHGSHVGSIAVGRGSQECTGCRGVAKGATLVSRKVGYKSSCSNGGNYFLWADSMAAFDSLASASIVNFSVGGTAAGDSSSFSLQWDRLIAQDGKVVTICAGNTGPSQAIWDPAVAYNAMTVANVDDRGTTGRGDDYVISASSRGPTLGGRKKPDLAAPGTAILGARFDWENNTDYVNFTGTSMAAPHVAGAAALLMNAGITNEKAVKAVLINTAESRVPGGWDASWGWGYLDLNTAFQHLTGFVSSVAPRLQAGSFRLYRGSTASFGKATVVWNRRSDVVPQCGGAGRTLNDLNLYAYDEIFNQLIGESVSTLDNVEQVLAPNRSSLVLKVSAACESFGAFTSEPYAIATPSGFATAAFPVFAPQLSTRSFVPDTVQTISVTITNPSSVAAHSVAMTLTLPAGFTLTSGTATQSTPHLNAGQSLTVSWGVRSPATLGNYQASLAVAQDSYGQAVTETATAAWPVAPPQLELTPAGLNWGAQIPGRNVPAKSFIVANPTSQSINITDIAVTGNFSVAHDCPATLAPSATCTVNVNFQNTVPVGVVNGSVTVATNAPTSPQVVALEVAVVDFALSISRPHRPSRTAIAPGQARTFEVFVNAATGLQGAMELRCDGTLPGVTCSVSPGTVRLAGQTVVAQVIVTAAPRSQRLRSRSIRSLVLKVHATMQGITRSIDLPVQIER